MPLIYFSGFFVIFAGRLAIGHPQAFDKLRRGAALEAATLLILTELESELKCLK